MHLPGSSDRSFMRVLSQDSVGDQPLRRGRESREGMVEHAEKGGGEGGEGISVGTRMSGWLPLASFLRPSGRGDLDTRSQRRGGLAVGGLAGCGGSVAATSGACQPCPGGLAPCPGACGQANGHFCIKGNWEAKQPQRNVCMCVCTHMGV